MKCTHCRSKALTKGLCNAHYLRRRNGRPMDVPVHPRGGTCMVCRKPNYGLGACKKHYNIVRSWIYKTALVAMLGGKCSQCLKKYPPSVFDFHHKKPKHKAFTIGAELRNVSWAALVKEVKKCKLLCANCHRLRHNQEGKWLGLKIQLTTFYKMKGVTLTT